MLRLTIPNRGNLGLMPRNRGQRLEPNEQRWPSGKTKTRSRNRVFKTDSTANLIRISLSTSIGLGGDKVDALVAPATKGDRMSWQATDAVWRTFDRKENAREFL